MNETFLSDDLNHSNQYRAVSKIKMSAACNVENNNISNNNNNNIIMLPITRSNSNSSISSMLSDEEDTAMQTSQNSTNEPGCTSPRFNHMHHGALYDPSISAFFSQLIDKNEKTSENFFYCIQCTAKFNSNEEFLKHCNCGEHHFKFANKDAVAFLTHLDAPRSIIVILLERKMKSCFMDRYSNDLLVANEETALCLEELNRDENAASGGEEFDETASNTSSTDSELSLLFIDYSIIQFSRVITILQDLYANNSDCARLTTDSNNNCFVSISSPFTSNNSNNNNSDKFNNRNSYNTTNLSSSQSLPVIDDRLRNMKNEPDEQFILAEDNSVRSTVIVNSVQHSRNACKKLKCPKCNWHYKYRETLDIHMREKHSADLANNQSEQCMYCIDNLPHPRLGRGEQYKCGYKPYRCEICDYSTTTKGNLSIHMQSDKHVNNVKEMKEKAVSANGDIVSSELTVGVDITEKIDSFLENSSNSSGSVSKACANASLNSIAATNNIVNKKIKDIYTSTFSLTSINSMNGKFSFYFKLLLLT